MTRPRHIPIRTCVACRETDEKRDLLRVVRLPEAAGVAYDPKGKMSGRGAYICARPECIALARKAKKLERSLKLAAPVTDDVFAALAARAEELARNRPAPSGETGSGTGRDSTAAANAAAGEPSREEERKTE